MRVLIQRVSRAGVSVDGSIVSEIGSGLILLVGVGAGDGPEDAAALAEKCAHLRIFEDEAGKMNRSALEVKGEVLAISQFTLYGDTRKGRRPSFVEAAPPERARPLYEAFVECLRGLGLRVGTGVFGAHMQVEIHNDGPVTIMVES
ncbi:MAG: D-tyrosyl-tRNA(Tyr) deacylase [Candidatus Latescibacteria bacterium]|nr:D-tyrosyl-tRNA(Tyr) deacylase [Candidatus Latescibacterota bacterium]